MKNKNTYVIAEIGLNHNGNLILAKKMILAAKYAGADAVKFQSFRTDEFMSNKKISYSYNKNKKRENMYKMFNRLEFKNYWYLKLKQFCDKKKIDFLTSVADIDSLKDYLKIKPKAIKVASEDIINYKLLKALSKVNKTIIISTGMADEEEIRKALKIFKNKKKIILLHCVSLYPTHNSLININRINTLKEKFNLRVGFSDHTEGIKASVMAAILGAVVIEKHFTTSRKLSGPDQKFSIEPNELKKMIKEIRLAKDMLGDGKIHPKSKELFYRRKFRRSIVANEFIKKNTKIKSTMLALKRPGTGLHPKYLEKIVGSLAKKNFKKNQKIIL